MVGRKLLSRAVIGLTFLLAGCITLPSEIKKNISTDGAHGTASLRFWPVTIFRTYSYLPGIKPGRNPNSVHHLCNSKSITIDLLQPAIIPAQEQEKICITLEEAARYSLNFNTQQPPTRYHILLIQDNSGFEKKSTTIYPAKKSFKYVFRYENESSLGDITDTLAHEDIHILTKLMHIPMQRDEEKIAWLAGSCARLEIIGHIPPENFDFDLASTREIAASTQAGEALQSHIHHLTNGKTLLKTSNEGRLFLGECKSILSAYLQRSP